MSIEGGGRVGRLAEKIATIASRILHKNREQSLRAPSMSAGKVARKGKWDQDLPFRSRQTFAIFPRRSSGWGEIETLGGPRLNILSVESSVFCRSSKLLRTEIF